MAACFSMLQREAACSSALQCETLATGRYGIESASQLCVAVCASMMQCVAVRDTYNQQVWCVSKKLVFFLGIFSHMQVSLNSFDAKQSAPKIMAFVFLHEAYSGGAEVDLFCKVYFQMYSLFLTHPNNVRSGSTLSRNYMNYLYVRHILPVGLFARSIFAVGLFARSIFAFLLDIFSKEYLLVFFLQVFDT